MSRLVVVGAGAAGAVIAARVAAAGAREVTLIEAGPDYPPEVELPADLRDGTRNSVRAHDWGYHHEPTRGQSRFMFPRGKVVGGSTAVNTCIALRGHPGDYDEWAARGLPEWSFERCLPAFRRLETDLDFPDHPAHGASGPIRVRRHPLAELAPWQAAFLEGCAALGFARSSDSNDPEQHEGYGPHAMNKIDGVRQGAGRCYLDRATRAKPNLRLLADTLARRVLFQGRRAIAVEVERRGRVERIEADEIVLAGGAIATPGLLLRSGVGPRREVERLGVDLVSEVSAVGARLLDHPGAAFIMIPVERGSRVADPLIQTVLRYTSSGSRLRGDMQLQPGSHLPMVSFSFPVVTLMCCVGKPRGHGLLRFPNADPRAAPHIDSRLLLHPDDHGRAAEAIELGWLVARQAAPSRIRAAFFAPPERVLAHRPSLLRALPPFSGSGYHPCGTAPMGADDDPDAATDQYGRVRGVSGLRVADASLMPTIPSSNTNFPTLMIGERFGEWLARA
jgi:choline dehydrogenase